MTGIRVIGGVDATPEDLEAQSTLHTNDLNRIRIVRTRAEKWLGGITALTGILTTALVIKGPQSTTDLTPPWRVMVGVLMLLALTELGFGIYRAYQSAYGDPNKLDTMPVQPISTLARRLREARADSADKALQKLASAIRATVIGVGLLTVAIGTTWFAPATAASKDGSVCLTVNGAKVAELPGKSITITTLAKGAAVTPCK